MEKMFLGIDDAGRGPVLGPMVLAGVLVSEEGLKKLRVIGVKDSKMLTPIQRENLAVQIKKHSSWHAVQISPREIDRYLATGTNLNKVEAIATAEIINHLAPSGEIHVMVDCPSVNIIAWRNTLLEFVKNKHAIVACEHKADVNHPEVSAASIIAKTTRDHEIDLLQKKIPENMGSGYPSDPVTKQFLKHAEKYKHLGIFRESWATFKALSGKKKQKSLGEF